MDNLESFTEHKFSVVIEEVDVSLSPKPTIVPEEQSLSNCVKEIKYLKETVKQLVSQINKQNHMITGIQSGLRNAVLSLSSCYTDDKIEEDNFPNQLLNYPNDPPETRPTELVTNFEDHLPPLSPNYNLTGLQCDQIEDPLKDVTTLSSISIESCSAPEDIPINPIIIPSASQAILLENESDDEDDQESNCDIDNSGNDNDELYSPSEVDITSDHEFDNDRIKKPKISSHPTKKTDNVKDEGTATSTELYRCTKCPKKFVCKTRRTFKDHMRRYHSKNPHKCHLCEKAYVKKSSLAHHIHSVHKGNRLKCAYCPGSFVQLGKLRVHEKIHLAKDGPPLQCCEFCGMNFRTVKSLLAHLGAMHKDAEDKHYAIGVKAIKNEHIKRQK